MAAASFSDSLVMASDSVFPVASYFFPLYRAVFGYIVFYTSSDKIKGQMAHQNLCPFAPFGAPTPNGGMNCNILLRIAFIAGR
ncbi:hypothetical protein [Flavonifractor hominis]|uniref:Uncharacterized protein n=1 Tax=Flavonifractor hominis TaxID=3133178 RepID=A0ABV1ENY5_9FIRM